MALFSGSSNKQILTIGEVHAQLGAVEYRLGLEAKLMHEDLGS
jgi:hypothetical protein